MIVRANDYKAACWNLDGLLPSRVNWSTPCDDLPSYSPDSKLVRISDHVWDLGTAPPSNISDSVNVLARFALEGNSLVSLDDTKLFKSNWELTKRRRFVTSGDHDLWTSSQSLGTNDAIETLQFGAHRFATRHDDHTVCVWSMSSPEKPLFESKHNLTFGSSSRPLALSPDGNVLLVFSRQGSVVWDLEATPPCEYPLQLDAYTTNAFFSEDNRRLFVADGLGVGIYDWVNNREVRRLTYPGPVRQIVRHLDGVHVATVNGNGTIYLLRLSELSGVQASP